MGGFILLFVVLIIVMFITWKMEQLGDSVITVKPQKLIEHHHVSNLFKSLREVSAETQAVSAGHISAKYSHRGAPCVLRVRHVSYSASNARDLNVSFEFDFQASLLNVLDPTDTVVFYTDLDDMGSWLHAQDVIQTRLATAHVRTLTPPSSVYIDHILDEHGKPQEQPIGLGLALLLKHGHLGEVDAMLRPPSAGPDVAHSVVSTLVRLQTSLKVTFSAVMSEAASAEQVRVFVKELVAHADRMADLLGAGDLHQRCLEHLEMSQDEPPGIKSMSARLLSTLLMKGEGEANARAREKFSSLVWHHSSQFAFGDMVGWFGADMLVHVADEALLAHGATESSDILREELTKRFGMASLLNNSALCWPLRKKILERLLSQDEGLALHGPPLMKGLSAVNFVECIGFLSVQASPLLWRAPWLIKTLRKRMDALEAAHWDMLYQDVFGEEHVFGSQLVSTRIARDTLSDAAASVFQERGASVFGSAALMHFHVLSHLAMESAPERRAMQWAQFVSQLHFSQVREVFKHCWMWNGHALLWLNTLCQQGAQEAMMMSQPGMFEQVLNTFELVCKRQEVLHDRCDLDTLVLYLFTRWRSDLDSMEMEKRYATLSKAYCERTERDGVTPTQVNTLNQMLGLVPRQQARALEYTLGLWIGSLDRGQMAGAMTSVDASPDLAGGLSLKQHYAPSEEGKGRGYE